MLHQNNSIFVQLSNYALHLCAFYCSIYIFESASATDFIEKKNIFFSAFYNFFNGRERNIVDDVKTCCLYLSISFIHKLEQGWVVSSNLHKKKSLKKEMGQEIALQHLQWFISRKLLPIIFMTGKGSNSLESRVCQKRFSSHLQQNTVTKDILAVKLV